MTVESILLDSEGSLKDAIYTMERTDKGIVLVIDKNSILIGTITDGDIRRSLFKFFESRS